MCHEIPEFFKLAFLIFVFTARCYRYDFWNLWKIWDRNTVVSHLSRRRLKSPSREYVPNVSGFGFFLVIEFSARKTFPIIIKVCLRESTETGASPRYPVFCPTPSELGDMLTGAWHR